MLATVPSNLKSPQWLAEQAEALAADAGLDLSRSGTSSSSPTRVSAGSSAVGQASATPAAADPARLHARPGGRRKAPTVVLVGKGITFDTGGLSIKPGEAHVDDEARHDRRRGRDGGDGRAGRGRLPGPGHRAGRPPRRTRSAATRCAPVTWSPTTAAARPRCSTPTPRAGWCSPTRWRTRSTSSSPTVAGRRRHAHRRDQGRARPAGRRRSSPTTTTLAARLCSTPARRPGSRCGGCRWRATTRTRSSSDGRRREERPGRARRDHRRAVPPALRRRRPVGPPRHRLGR